MKNNFYLSSSPKLKSVKLRKSNVKRKEIRTNWNDWNQFNKCTNIEYVLNVGISVT